MKTKIGFLIIMFIVAFTNLNAQEVSTTDTDADSELLGLPGDNLDLYAVLDLFQKSKTIEEFEKSLNEEETGVNNLDLNLDDEVDFIKIETKQDKDDFVFVLQVDVLEGEIQDVAVILVSKDDDGKVAIQIVGDEELYGKDYVIEPKLEAPAVTANPAYSGPDTVVVSQPATVVVVESEPIVQYVYSPVYVPYYPPYYYGYYPPYYTPYPVISINIYFGSNRHHHNHYYGGRNNRGGNTVVINNNNTYNNYSKTRNTSNTVNHNKNSGNYKSNRSSTRPSTEKPKDTRPDNAKKATNEKGQSKPKPESQKNDQKSNVKAKENSVPSNTSKAKPSSKPVHKPANKPSGKPKGKPKRR